MKYHYKFKVYIPLIAIITVIVLFTTVYAYLLGSYSVEKIMPAFMAYWFLVFSSFKIFKLKGFAEAYAMYDIIAKKSSIYAHAYPFIEFLLGLAFIFHFHLVAISWFTLALMIINSIGVFRAIRDQKTIMCACMGTVFKLPMSYVTLAEDLLMAVMAAGMLVLYYF